MEQQVTEDQLAALAPYVAGARPDSRGELEIYCPMHPDTRRSCSVNVLKGVWYCHAGCGGGSVRHLLLNEDAWVPVDGRMVEAIVSAPSTASTRLAVPSFADVAHWHARLHRERRVAERLMKLRGLLWPTLERAEVGWDGRAYTIPVWSPRRRLWNVRRYDPEPRPGRSKIWNTRGMGKARLYPVGRLERATIGSDVLLVEGEWDALMCIQSGHTAVTRTDGAGKPWHDSWTEWFVGLNVYVCYDRDVSGIEAESVAVDALRGVARFVNIISLPYPVQQSGGKDISDYLLPHRLAQRNQIIHRLKREAVPAS